MRSTIYINKVAKRHLTDKRCLQARETESSSRLAENGEKCKQSKLFLDANLEILLKSFERKWNRAAIWLWTTFRRMQNCWGVHNGQEFRPNRREVPLRLRQVPTKIWFNISHAANLKGVHFKVETSLHVCTHGILFYSKSCVNTYIVNISLTLYFNLTYLNVVVFGICSSNHWFKHRLIT